MVPLPGRLSANIRCTILASQYSRREGKRTRKRGASTGAYRALPGRRALSPYCLPAVGSGVDAIAVPVVTHNISMVVAVVVAAIVPAAGIPYCAGIVAGCPDIPNSRAGRNCGYHHRRGHANAAVNANLSLGRRRCYAQKTGKSKCPKYPFHPETSWVPSRTSLDFGTSHRLCPNERDAAPIVAWKFVACAHKNCATGARMPHCAV